MIQPNDPCRGGSRRNLDRHSRRPGVGPGVAGGVSHLRQCQLSAEKQAAQIRDAGCRGRLPGLCEEPVDLDDQHLQPDRRQPAGGHITWRSTFWRVSPSCRRCSSGACIAAGVRVWRADAVDGCRTPTPLARQRYARARAASRVDQIRHPRRHTAVFVTTRDMLIYRYVEPFWMFGLFATPPLWVGLGVLLIATVFVRNLYCRFRVRWAQRSACCSTDRVSHQALERVQHLLHLSEGMNGAPSRVRGFSSPSACAATIVSAVRG